MSFNLDSFVAEPRLEFNLPHLRILAHTRMEQLIPYPIRTWVIIIINYNQVQPMRINYLAS